MPSPYCIRPCAKCAEPFGSRVAKQALCRRCSNAQRGLNCRRPLEDRFWAKVDKSGECWLWMAHRTTGGYGRFTPRNGAVPVFAHRLSWEFCNGPIPEGLFVLHNCPGGDNPACVNPDHLWLGTLAENSADMIKKGRQASGARNPSRLYPENVIGERNGRSKLTDEQVLAIRGEYQGDARGNRHHPERRRPTFKDIAAKYGVSWVEIRRIVKRENWSHL